MHHNARKIVNGYRGALPYGCSGITIVTRENKRPLDLDTILQCFLLFHFLFSSRLGTLQY